MNPASRKLASELLKAVSMHIVELQGLLIDAKGLHLKLHDLLTATRKKP